jgi:hypothetical protein
MSVIGDLSLSIFQTEFDSDTGIMPRSHISGWLSENLGYLNTLLNTSYSGSNPSIDLEAQSIYKELYLSHYYRKQSRNALRGIVGTSEGRGDILSLKDGDSAVTFTNKNEVAKVYKSMADDSQSRLDKLVCQYNIYQSTPLQVGGIEGHFFTGLYN